MVPRAYQKRLAGYAPDCTAFAEQYTRETGDTDISLAPMFQSVPVV